MDNVRLALRAVRFLRQALLSTAPSVLSCAVSRLEARLGWRLLQRATLRMDLTDAGRLYLEQVRTAFGLLDHAERDVQGKNGALAGRVRLSVPTNYAHYRLPPMLARFAQQHPQVQVELNITNRNVDLVAEGFDRAIHLGQLPDSGLVARKLEEAPLLLVAAPDYLQRRGTPQTLDDLEQHMCLPFVMPRTGRLWTGCRVRPLRPPTICWAWCRWPSRVLASARGMSSSCGSGYSAGIS